VGELHGEHPDREGDGQRYNKLGCLVAGVQPIIVHFHSSEISREAVPLGSELSHFLGGNFEALGKIGGLGRGISDRREGPLVGFVGGIQTSPQEEDRLPHFDYCIPLLLRESEKRRDGDKE